MNQVKRSQSPFNAILLGSFVVHGAIIAVLWEPLQVSKSAMQVAPTASISLGFRTASAGHIAAPKVVASKITPSKIAPQLAIKQVIQQAQQKSEKLVDKTAPIKTPSVAPQPIKKPNVDNLATQKTPIKTPIKTPLKTEVMKTSLVNAEVQKKRSAQPLQVAQIQGAQGVDGSANNQLKVHESGQSEQLSGNPNNARYDAQLRQHLMKFKRYPRALKIKRKEGSLEVLFTINQQGELLTKKIIKRSGDRVFDKAVRRLFERAKPFPKPPKETSWTKREYQLAFTYTLGNQ